MILSIVSLLSSPWTTFESDSLTFTHNLLNSVSTPSNYKYSDYTCLSSLSCKNPNNSDLCAISLKLEKARNIYLIFEIISLFIMLMIIERLIFKILNRPSGSVKFLLFLIWIFPLVKSIGLATFLIISNVSLDNGNGSKDVKSESGVIISFTALGLSIAGSLLMIVGRISSSQKLIKLNINVPTSRFVNPLFIFTISQVLLILSIVYPTASYNDFSEITTNIHYVFHKDNFYNLPMSCVAGQECQVLNQTCSIFDSLFTTEKILRIIEIISYGFLFLWIESFTHLLLKIRIGTNFVNYSYPVLYVIFKLIELIVYIASANISYGADCNIEEFTNGYQLCAEIGTTFYIIGTVFTFLSMIVYELSYGIYAAHSGTPTIGKVVAEPEDDLKKNHVKELSITNLDNFADKTSSDMKLRNEDLATEFTLNSAASIIVEECNHCKKPFKNNESGITEGKNKYHYRCYVISGTSL